MPLKGYKQTQAHREKASKNLVHFKKGVDSRRKLAGSPGYKLRPETIAKMKGPKKRKKGQYKTRDNQRLRCTAQYLEWRKKVYERDNYTCMECHARNIRVNAHHIKEFAKYPELRYEIENGVTLCERCHKLKHKFTLY